MKNDFLNSALRTVGDFAYQNMGGKELAAAQRRNARVQAKRGFLGSFADKKYWGDIATATRKVGTFALGGPALKAATGVLKAGSAAARAANTALKTKRAGQPLPPTVARPAQPPRPANIFDEITPDNPYGITSSLPSTSNISRSKVQDLIRQEAADYRATSLAYKAQQRGAQAAAQQASSRASAMKQPFTASKGNVIKGSFAAAATTGGVAGASTRRTTKSAAQIAYEEAERRARARGAR